MFKECLKNSIIPFITIDKYKLYYYRGLKEYNNQKGWLIDTIKNSQDEFIKLCERFLKEQLFKPLSISLGFTRVLNYKYFLEYLYLFK